MKKVMIAILLLVPLIVILTMSVSSMIISAEYTIAIESMEIVHLGERIDTKTIKLEDYKPTNKPYQLLVNFYPRMVKDKNVSWESSDEKVATISQTGVLRFVDYGMVKITVRSENDATKSATCTFYVVGDSIDRIEISSYDGNLFNEKLELKKYQSYPILANVVPSTALGNNKVDFAVENPQIATVDQNGIITALEEGKTVLTVKAKGKTGSEVEAQLPIEISGEMLAISDVFYSSNGNFALQNILSGAVTDVEVYPSLGVKIEGDTLSLLTGVDEAYVTIYEKDNKAIEQKVLLKRALDNDLHIKNLESLKKGVWEESPVLPIGGSNIILEVVSSLGELPENVQVVWTSSKPEILKVENGRLYGVSDGKAFITARAEGYNEVTIGVSVQAFIDFITLDLSETEDKVGLKQERVFGIYTYDGETVSNKLPLVIESTSPENAQQNFYYTSSNEAYATVSSNGIITFKEAGIGKKVTISVIAKSSYGVNPASASYTFNLVDGINFGLYYNSTDENGQPCLKKYGENLYDEEAGIMPSFKPYEDMKYLMNTYWDDYNERGKASALVFHTNVYMTSTEEGSRGTMEFNRGIYGNGHKYDGQFHIETHPGYSASLFKHKCPFEKDQSGNDIVVENIAFQCAKPTDADPQEAFEALKNGGGMGYQRFKPGDYGERWIKYRYCLFQYAYGFFNIRGGYYEMEGCVFRNTAGPSFVITTGDEEWLELKIKNCIFSNSISCMLLATLGDVAEQGEPRKYYSLHFEGKNYVYNWKKVDRNADPASGEIRLDVIPDGVLPTDELTNVINSNVTKFMNKALQSGENDHVLYKGVNTYDYFNFAFLCMGLWDTNNIRVNPEDDGNHDLGVNVYGENISVDTIDFEGVMDNAIVNSVLREFGIDLDDPEKASQLVSPVDENGNWTTAQGESFNIDDEALARLRGE